jgi:hypothetical protein
VNIDTDTPPEVELKMSSTIEKKKVKAAVVLKIKNERMKREEYANMNIVVSSGGGGAIIGSSKETEEKRRCAGERKNGGRCSRKAVNGEYCESHKEKKSLKMLWEGGVIVYRMDGEKYDVEEIKREERDR